MVTGIQDINGTKFRYNILNEIGSLNGKKAYNVVNIDTGSYHILWEGEFKLIED